LREFFEPTQLSSESRELVTTMNRILRNYQSQGYDLSLRQLYYQLVSRNIITNEEKSYKRIGSILSDARLAGLVDWSMIVDRGRECVQNSHWDSPASIVDACANQFRFDTWQDQPWHIEVMVEKQALEGVLEPVCRRLDIPFTANKGYSSSSAMHEAGKRMKSKLDTGRNICVIYLGDHDPSGIDMSRDVEDRLKIFAGYRFWAPTKDEDEDPEFYRKAKETLNARYFTRYLNDAYDGLEFKVERAALNMDQIDEYNPPPNPAKITDSRAESYIRKFGNESWELDALEPSVLAGLVEKLVEQYRDDNLYDEALTRQDEAREKIKNVAAKLEQDEEGY